MNRKYKHRRKRYRKSFVIFRLFLLIGIPILIIYSLGLFFRINNVEIVENTVYTSEEIMAEIDIETGDSLIFLNNFGIASNILANLAYVDEVKVERVFPDTVLVTLTPSEVFGAIQSEDEKYYLMDQKGKVLEQVSLSDIKSELRIFGLEFTDAQVAKKLEIEDSYKLDSLLEMYNVLKANGFLEDITEIHIDKIYDIKVLYKDIYEIYFGSMEDFEYKTLLLNETLKKLDDETEGIIELSNKSEARFIPLEVEPTPYGDEVIITEDEETSEETSEETDDLKEQEEIEESTEESSEENLQNS